jgi:hypothetical protein
MDDGRGDDGPRGCQEIRSGGGFRRRSVSEQRNEMQLAWEVKVVTATRMRAIWKPRATARGCDGGIW